MAIHGAKARLLYQVLLAVWTHPPPLPLQMSNKNEQQIVQPLLPLLLLLLNLKENDLDENRRPLLLKNFLPQQGRLTGANRDLSKKKLKKKKLDGSCLPLNYNLMH